MTGREPPTSPEPTSPEGNTREEIHREHQALRSLLAHIEGTQLLSDLVPLVATLRHELEDHFRTEERADGLHAAIANRDPRFVRSLEIILEEHKEFMQTTDSLLARARTCLEQKESILRDALRLAHRLHDHEARETQLLADTLYIDLGRGS